MSCVHEEHKVSPAGSIDVPLVEGVSHAALQLMMDADVAGGEVPGHVSIKDSHDVFEEISDAVAEPRLVHKPVVSLFVGKRVSSAHLPSAHANPRPVVECDGSPREAAMAQLVREHEVQAHYAAQSN